MKAFFTFLAVLIFLNISAPQTAHAEAEVDGQACFRLEGNRLKGCVTQARGAECGPPKPCPTYRFYVKCSTYTSAVVIPKQDCDSWSHPSPVCTPDGCTTPSPECLHWTDNSYCRNETNNCGISPHDEPNTGTYSCSYFECGHPPPPPGYMDCGMVPECPESTVCTGG